MTLPVTIPGPRVVGLDLSLTATGIAVIADHRAHTQTLHTPLKGHARLKYLAEKVCDWCADADLILVEAAVSYARGDNALIMGGMWYVITHELWREGQPYVVIQPAQLKKYAIGRGSGKDTGKEQVGYEAVRRFPGVMVSNNDEADALWLAHMGCDWLGWPLITVPQQNRTALDSVRTWPERDTIRKFPAPNPGALVRRA